LAAVPAKQIPKALRALAKAKVEAWVIGEVVSKKPGVTVL
jgi:hydrogenase maturation factor